RDEAHRASNEIRLTKGRGRLRSALDAIPGVRPRTRGALLTQLGSVDGIRGASDEALRAAGANRRQIAALRAHLPPAPGRPEAAPEEAAEAAEQSAVEDAERWALAEAFRDCESESESESESGSGSGSDPVRS